MKNFLIIAAVIVLLGAAGYWYTSRSGSISPLSPFSPISLPNDSSPHTIYDSPSTNSAPYSDPNFHFSLSYPKDLDVHIYDETDGGRTVAFEGASPGEGFQVFVVPYTEKAITAERFKTDDPSGVMKNPTDISLDGSPAKIFYGHNDQMGDTREVWTIHGGYLYEVTTYKPLDNWLGTIMTTFKFI